MNLLIFAFIPLLAGIIMSLGKNKKLQILGDFTRIYLLVQSLINLYIVTSSDTPITQYFTNSGILGIGLISDRISSLLVVTTAILFFVFGIYMKNKKDHDNLFHCLVLVIEGLSILIFLSVDLFNIFILVEVSTIICGILIMYLREKRSVYDGLVYIMLNTVGIMFYLIGVGMIYKVFGNLDIPSISQQIISLPREELVLPFAFLMCGMSVKAALFPAFLWLPKAHGTPGAPSIVSAILSGIYIKTSLYVLIKLFNIFRPVFQPTMLFLILGILTALLGIIFAVLSTDMKMILAYHTISQMGLIIIGISSSNIGSYFGGILHIINHALFKSLLFLSVGTITHMYKSRKYSGISGLMKRSPIVGISLLVGILGITGAPLFNGSVSKYLISTGYTSIPMRFVLELINLGTTLSFIKLGSMLLGYNKEKDNAPINDKIALSISSILVFLTGIFGFKIYSLMTNEVIIMTLGSMLEKALVWIVYVIFSIIIFKYVLPRFKISQDGISLDLSFNTMVFSILAGFFIYLSYGVFFI